MEGEHTFVTLVVLELLECHKRARAGDQLVAELGLVVGLLDFVVVVLGVVEAEHLRGVTGVESLV